LKGLCLALCASALYVSTGVAWAASKKKHAPKYKSGADSEEGYIVKQTQDGRIIKIPKKQTFKFGESDIQGEANRPSESILSPRNGPPRNSLIPVRKSFRRESLDTLGYQERQSP
jgi:hypothetical protein